MELARADREHADRDWANAVREYYAALEGGLKYALGEEVSVRSARSHGGGPQAAKAGEVGVGSAEALRVGNLTRTLLVYIAQRPPRTE